MKYGAFTHNSAHPKVKKCSKWSETHKHATQVYIWGDIYISLASFPIEPPEFHYISVVCMAWRTHSTMKPMWLNTMTPRQNCRHLADDIFKCIFLNENAWISLTLKFIPKVRININNIPALVPIMAWRRPGDQPLSAAMMVRLSTHVCVTRPQWVKLTNLQRNDFTY